MKRFVSSLAIAAVSLVVMVQAVSAESTVSLGGNKKYEKPQSSGGKGYYADDKDDKKTEKKEERSKGYEFKYENKHGGTKEDYLLGNTKRGEKNGGWWVSRDHGGEWSWGVGGQKEKGNNNGQIGGNIGGGYSDSIGVGTQTGRWGNDKWGVQGRLEGRIKGEIKAALEAAIKNDDAFAGFVAEVAAEGTVSAEGSASGVFAIGGVPVTVTGKIEGHWGISGHAGIRAGYDKEKKKFVVQEGVGFSLGFGASETVTVEVDAEAFCRAVGLDKEWEAFLKKLNGENQGGDPFDDVPDSGPSGGGGGSPPAGITPLKY